MSNLIPARFSTASPASFLRPSDSPQRHGPHPILIRQRNEIIILPADDVDDDAAVSSELCQSFSVFSTLVTRLSNRILLHLAEEEEVDAHRRSDRCQEFVYLKYFTLLIQLPFIYPAS
jgi:hypothetical protein